MLLSAVNGSVATVARYNHLRQTISGFVATFLVTYETGARSQAEHRAGGTSGRRNVAPAEHRAGGTSRRRNIAGGRALVVPGG